MEAGVNHYRGIRAAPAAAGRPAASPGEEALHLVNTMSRRKEPFRPRQPPPASPRAAARPVKVFTCGPSVYRRPHIGNYRTFLFEDVLVRYLEYLGYEVQRVINFTDVEDKTIREAANRGRDVRSLTRQVEEQFYREAGLLRIRLPSFIPRSSTCVPQAARIIRALVESGVAYWHEGDVFFDPLKFPGFGRLFGLDMSRWPRRKVRFRRDTYPGQQWNRGDFILWHGYREGDPVYWDTEIGRGRPSWNVQDPAIIVETLGPAIDIHCGGIDNLYRHHDYTIAVTESYTGRELAPYWLHGEHLTVGGRPMSKSRGNILYPQDVLAVPPGPERPGEGRFGEGRFGPCHLRFFLIYTHYRRRLSYTEARFRRAAAELDAFRSLAAELTLTRPASGAEGSGPSPEAGRLIDERIDRIPAEFERRMNDDLSAGAAFDRLHALLREIDARRQGAALSRPRAERLRRNLERVDAVLQVIF